MGQLLIKDKQLGRIPVSLPRNPLTNVVFLCSVMVWSLTARKLITTSQWKSEGSGTFFLGCVGGNIIAVFDYSECN